MVGTAFKPRCSPQTPDTADQTDPNGIGIRPANSPGLLLNDCRAITCGSRNVHQPYGFNPGSKTYAGHPAAMTRQQWANHVSTFVVPLENQLIKYATDPNVVSNAMSEASRDETPVSTRKPDRSTSACARPAPRSTPISKPRANATPVSAALA